MMNYPLQATIETNTNIAVTAAAAAVATVESTEVKTLSKQKQNVTYPKISRKRTSTGSLGTPTAEGVTLQPFDVLSGRDKQSFNHIGNRRFRVVVGMNLQRYLDTKSRFERSEMILAFVRELRGDGKIRFIKRRGSKYIELDEKQSREKVGHALRDAAAQARQQAKAAEASGEGQTSNKNTTKTVPKKKKTNSKSKAAKSKQQLKKKQQQKGVPQQPSYETMPSISSALPPLTLSSTTLPNDLPMVGAVSNNNTDEEEFSLSDDSLDSLLSLVDEQKEEQHQQPLHNHLEETLPPFMLPLPNFGETATARESVVHLMNTDLNQYDFAAMITSEVGAMIEL